MVRDAQLVARRHLPKQRLWDRQRLAAARRGLGRLDGSQPRDGRAGITAHHVAGWPQAHEMARRPDRAGAKLRPGKIRLDPALATHNALGLAQVGHHATPRVGVVVGAIDTHYVHAGAQQVDEKLLVARGLRGHRHHDPDRTESPCRPEQRPRVIVQQQRAGSIVHQRRRLVARHAAGQSLQVADHGVQACNYV